MGREQAALCEAELAEAGAGCGSVMKFSARRGVRGVCFEVEGYGASPAARLGGNFEKLVGHRVLGRESRNAVRGVRWG